MFFDVHPICRGNPNLQIPGKPQCPNSKSRRTTDYADHTDREELYPEYQSHPCNPWSQASQSPNSKKAAEPRISRITRIWKNCIPNISAICVIRGHAPWDLGFGIWDLPPRQCPKKAKATRGRVRTPKAIAKQSSRLALISRAVVFRISVPSVNRADGISEIECKAAMGSGERVGKGASFKSVVTLLEIWVL